MFLLNNGRSHLLLILTVLVPILSCAQQNQDFPISDTKLEVDTISTDFKNPWSFTFLPDGALLVTEKEGKLYRLAAGSKQEISGLPDIYVRGQGGLLDVELHPQYDTNHWIYFSYGSSVEGEKGGNTTVMRAKLNGLTLESKEEIFRATPESAKGQHWGGRLVFDREGYLYVSVGDRGARDENPQSLTNHSGKIHRLHDDGRIPDDNPFVGRNDAIGSIFTQGHRNPQGIALHPGTGEVWAHEHGPRGGDELNIIRKGNNYGWPVITYGINYSGTKITDETEKEGMEQPVYYWTPSIAPCGMTFISGNKYPAWNNSVLIGSLKFNYIHRCELSGDQVIAHEKLLDGFGRIRSIKQSPDGFIYFSAEGKGIFKIRA